MNRISLKRIDAKISAELSIDGKYYEGSIDNLSEEGLFEIVLTDIENTDFTLKKNIRVKFHRPSGEDLDLKCQIIWLRLNRDNHARLKCCMGMEIISPPESYKSTSKLSNISTVVGSAFFIDLNWQSLIFPSHHLIDNMMVSVL